MTAALEVRGLSAGYNGIPALRELSFTIAPGEVLALLGPNGAGKTTALLSMVGAIPKLSGSVSSFGVELTKLRVDRIARLGIALVPDDRGLFFSLTVGEHLRLARSSARAGMREEVLDLFPQLPPLLTRRCALLSGGEQQMLALAKTLLADPRVLLIDEMSLGLAPLVVQGLLPVIRTLATERGTAIVLVEQHIDLALRVADQAIVLNQGRVTLEGHAADLRRQRTVFEAAYFATAAAGATAPSRVERQEQSHPQAIDSTRGRSIQ